MSTVRLLRPTTCAAAVVAAVLALSGCGNDSAAPTTTERPTAATSQTTDPPVAADATEVAEWQRLELTDTDDETFTVAELSGRPVFVENFATWCSNCRSQLKETQKAAALAGDDAVFLALSVETDLDPADLKEYQQDNGFSDVRFAVMSPELLAAMDAEFGGSALNPPSTPKVAVAAGGTAGDLVTGPESAQDILSSLGLR